MKKRIVTAVLFAALCLPFAAYGAQTDTEGQQEETTTVEKEFSEVSVHDPSVIQGDDGAYYIFGSHLAVAKSDDLINWTYVNRGVKNKNDVIPNVYSQMKEAFEWAHSNTFWAPDVVKLNDGTYRYYYCNCQGDQPLSCLGIASSDSVAGPYTNLGILLKSGMDASEKDEDGDLYQATRDPNVVDPVVLYDNDGKLWMVYGSYSGGIFVKEMDPETGMPLESGYGEKLLGGNHLRIEGPYVIYNQDTGYYYMFLSFGGLDSDGGYNVRVCRSESVNGPYVDSLGNEMIDCKGPSGTTFSDVTAEQYGTKLMGGYEFSWGDDVDSQGYLSPGHNSCLYQEETGKYFIIYHTRFDDRGEEHEVRVHQMFFNEDGWPVITPYRYTGETAEAVTAADAAGSYQVIDHQRDISAEMKVSQEVSLGEDGTVSGALDGTWSLSGDYSLTIATEDGTWKGVFLKQWDDDRNTYAMTFSVVSSEKGTALWGSSTAMLAE